MLISVRIHMLQFQLIQFFFLTDFVSHGSHVKLCLFLIQISSFNNNYIPVLLPYHFKNFKNNTPMLQSHDRNKPLTFTYFQEDIYLLHTCNNPLKKIIFLVIAVTSEFHQAEPKKISCREAKSVFIIWHRIFL